MKRIIIKLLWFSLLGLVISSLSCTTSTNIIKEGAQPHMRGVWHKVEEGQTLWRIAKTYRISLMELKEENDIDDVMHISRGTWIFIPGAEKQLYVQGNSSSSPKDQAKFEFTWPVKGEIIRPFGKFEKDFNYGIDVRIRGSEDIIASQKGTVVLSNILRGYGNTIIIEHENDFCSLYARDIKSYVREGQSVEKNTVIAKVDPGKSPETTIVHYELFYRGKPVNPLYYLP